MVRTQILEAFIAHLHASMEVVYDKDRMMFPQ